MESADVSLINIKFNLFRVVTELKSLPKDSLEKKEPIEGKSLPRLICKKASHMTTKNSQSDILMELCNLRALEGI